MFLFLMEKILLRPLLPTNECTALTGLNEKYDCCNSTHLEDIKKIRMARPPIQDLCTRVAHHIDSRLGILRFE